MPFAICSLKDLSRVDPTQPFCFTACTDQEHSLICPQDRIPDNVLEHSGPWRCFRVRQTMDLDLVDNFAKMTPENKTETVERTKTEVLEMLKQTIRPEFLNRIDEIIMFTPLNRTEIEEIVGLQIASIQRMLRHSSGIELEVTPAALSLLADEGYDPEFGARPVKRAIHRLVLNQLSKDILAQKVDRNHPIVIDAADDNLVFRN